MSGSVTAGILLASTLILMSACAEPSPAVAVPATYRSALIEGVPHIRQKPDFCGEACAAMYLRKLGEPVDQDYVFDRSGTDPSLGRGAFAAELNQALLNIGFDTGKVWHRISSRSDTAEHFAALHADLVRGVPSIVCMHASDGPNAPEHFRLVLGYDAASDSILYHEPAEEDGAYRRMSREHFLSLWPLKGDRGWTVIRLRLELRALEYGEVSTERTAADYAQHVMTLRPSLPPGFTVVVEPPFVVIGDEPAETVRTRAATTIRWAVVLLKKDFFTRDPDEILDIWLFGSGASYRRYAKELFGHEPDTPYGYYSEPDHALVMNIATGGGTLVHEIVHPFVRANFPDCPAWFNEGLGSLYEACRDRGGHIDGLPNWRLPGLQRAIEKGSVPSFEHLTQTTDDEFYGEDPGTNYSEARYLLYYLQEHGLLVQYYRAFLENRTSDPSGYRTLKTILGEDDMDRFQKHWERWVMGISEAPSS